jgi:transposase-like protein
MKKRHTPEQIVRKLREADALLSAGASVADVSRKLGVSEATYHRWRRKYEGMEVQELKKLKALEQENARLKAIVAEQAVDIRILKEVAEGNF